MLLGPLSALLLRGRHGSCLAPPAGLRMGPASSSSSSLGSSGVGLGGVTGGGLAAAQVAGLAGPQVAAQGPGVQGCQGPPQAGRVAVCHCTGLLEALQVRVVGLGWVLWRQAAQVLFMPPMKLRGLGASPLKVAPLKSKPGCCMHRA